MSRVFGTTCHGSAVPSGPRALGPGSWRAGTSAADAAGPRSARPSGASPTASCGSQRSASSIRPRSCITALVWIWQTRLSVTPRTWPIWARVRLS